MFDCVNIHTVTVYRNELNRFTSSNKAITYFHILVIVNGDTVFQELSTVHENGLDC